MPVALSFVGVEDFRRLGAVMKSADADLRKEMKKTMATRVSKPILNRMREEAMAMQVHGIGPGGSTAGPKVPGRGKGGMRRAIAMSVRSVVADTGNNPGVRVETVPSRMHRGKHSELLPQYADEVGTWRHPIMGNRKAWATTVTSTGWFSRPAEEGMNDAAGEFARVLTEFAERLAAKL